jgi:hypothetical protein
MQSFILGCEGSNTQIAPHPSSSGQSMSIFICDASNPFRLETQDKGAKPQQSEEVGAG